VSVVAGAWWLVLVHKYTVIITDSLSETASVSAFYHSAKKYSEGKECDWGRRQKKRPIKRKKKQIAH